VRNLERFCDWLRTGLIYLDPMVATAYYQAVAEDETSQSDGRRGVPDSCARLAVPLSHSSWGAGELAGVSEPWPAPARP
jgi:hypothetical protein